MSLGAGVKLGMTGEEQALMGTVQGVVWGERGRLGWGQAGVGTGWGMENSPIASGQVGAWQGPQEAAVHWGGVQDHDSDIVIG